MRAPRTHAVVYRAVTADDTVLYVGMSTSIGDRLRSHAESAPWWSHLARIELDSPLPLAEAFRSEADQITLLRPTFNKISGVETRFGPDLTTEREWLSWKVAYEAGMTLEEIALEGNVSPKTVRVHLVELGTVMRRGGAQVGKPQLNCTRIAECCRPSDGVVHIAFAGARAVKRRRGGKALAA